MISHYANAKIKRATERRDLAKMRCETAQLNMAYKQYVNPNLAASKDRGRGWTQPGVAERDLSRWDREQAMAQARELCETKSIVAGMVQTCVDNVIGPEYRLKMTTADVNYNKAVEELWRMDKDRLDIRGIRSWGKLQRCWQYRKIIDGDVGIQKFVDDREKAFRVVTVEAERIRCKKADYLDQGIEFDEYGRHKRYFIGRRPINQIDMAAQLEDGTPVSADDMILYAHYPNERSERMRGSSMLLPCFNELRDIDEIMGAITQKIKNAAFIALKFKMEMSPTGSIFGAGLEQSKTSADGKKRTHVPMVAGTNLNLGETEDVSVLESTVPNSELVPFLRFRLRHVGACLGMPLEFMLMEFDGSYSSARAVMEMAKRRYLCEQQSAGYVASDVFCGWLQHQITSGRVTVPTGLIDPLRHRWGKSGWPYINPQQEVGAQEMQIANSLKSRAQILQETTGGDIDDVITELGHEAKAMVAAGLKAAEPKPPVPENTPQVEE